MQMAEYKMAPIIKAITDCMPCTNCPYPCQAKDNSSRANCVARWYHVLHYMKNDGDRKAVHAEVYNLVNAGRR